MLPISECRFGYSQEELREILGDRLEEFNTWMSGQTVAICDGMYYDYDAAMNLSTGCGPHGDVVYSWDLEDFLAGRADLD